MPIIAVFSKRTDKIYIQAFSSVKDLHSRLRLADPDLMPLEEFMDRIKKLPFSFAVRQAATATLLRVIEFSKVPSGRSCDEIVAAMYYAAGQESLCEGFEIRARYYSFQVLASPEQFRNFDWNIAGLIRKYRQAFHLLAKL